MLGNFLPVRRFYTAVSGYSTGGNTMPESKNRSLCTFIIGALSGALIFILIFGVSVIVPTNTDWLFAYYGDVTQHQLGWEFYRDSPAAFPVCLTDGLSSEGAVSCLYSDSIPLFALIFKPLSPLLPDNFQYFGIWGVMCFALNGGFGALLLYRIKPDILFASAGSLFYSMFPPTADRIMHHNSLGAIWLIIIPLILCLDRNKEYKHKYTYPLYWSLTCMLAAAIHPYFLPMIFMVMAGYAVLAVFRDKQLKKAAVVAVSSAVASVAVLFLTGAFYGSGSYADGGFGLYCANMNTFFNGMGHSSFLNDLPIFDGQGEGFGYIGLGAVICCIIAAVTVIVLTARKEGSFSSNAVSLIKINRIELIAFLMVFFISFFWAVSTKMTFNSTVIADLPMPYLVRGALSVFRASGRYIWLAGILLTTAALAGVAKLGKKAAVIAAVLCVAVQALDMREWYSAQHDKFAAQPEYEFALKDEKWDRLTEDTSEIIFLPMSEGYGLYMNMYFDFAQLAEKKNMRLSSFYLARLDFDAVSQYAQREYNALKAGKGRKDVLYVFFNREDAVTQTDSVSVYEIDGYTVAKVK